MRSIETLEQFYELMHETKSTRRVLSCLHFRNEPYSDAHIAPLKEALMYLNRIPEANGQKCLKINDKKTIHLDLAYEIGELKKDIFFLENNEPDFFKMLSNLHENFNKEVSEGVNKLKDIHFKVFITDRDGTVNNYCGRYASSIQSAYNAVFLSRFAQCCADNSIILTSAPLDNIGLVDLSVSPKNAFVFAGSKGREYFNKEGRRCQFPIAQEKQNILNILNERLGKLVKEPKYLQFFLIGSGLQYKFGQTTITRQDITKTIPEDESLAFKETIENIIKEIDPESKYFRIEDTGKDLELILTIQSSNDSKDLKDFDKGDGVLFLNNDLKLGMEAGPNLICGDTSSDIPMISSAIDKSDDVYSIFVTKDDALKEKVKNTCRNSIIVSEPDILVTILNNLAQ
ncbi:MAG: hypothetical protein A2Y03_00390 [Omnitrophica WOR_2 bacterium GWF2_38_59]|nr:MAG: hypothetical protein A2Y03_00390 [Omnitrophica WOR_2 bacterium GWF2_38_59]OGX47727.1 MAG: hypothetical protein A2243_00280 [Omnitrophica WOR_2 bacterium RIFOXYA2_FULL_38_17]OGX55766.1 MAG: hypothetical protein A2306_10970 [Omnitrophica WOR_2 bacterium RIFOXYB2_FULL_38_16]OGX57741.1 MAG: hypothetical protein A2447_06565 [Omnitrophica WOR_2 bacterium RIFOXYC2_FULL_38_12]HBG60393.1 trehalose 6-phosphate synthase [Candidatus Omnitrophota bacterium]